MKQKAARSRCSTRGLSVDVLWSEVRWSLVSLLFIPLPPRLPLSLSLSVCSLSVAAIVSGDDTVLLTPGRMSQRQVKERDKEREREREKEAGLQTPNREHVATPSTLSPGVSYSHGKRLPLHSTVYCIQPKFQVTQLLLQFSFGNSRCFTREIH